MLHFITWAKIIPCLGAVACYVIIVLTLNQQVDKIAPGMSSMDPIDWIDIDDWR